MSSSVIAYLTSQYPATSHTFIRREVTALRSLGLTIETFSVRSPAEAEVRSASDREEARRTFTLLAQPWHAFVAAHARSFVGSPLRYIRTLLLALRHRVPGVKASFLAVAHFGEAILLATELRRRGIGHLHNHFANSGATVGLLASRFAEIEWSFTIHGISEFDYPAGLLLPDKIAAARFVACVSYFGQAQAARLIDQSHWPKLKIVRCGLELDRLPPRNSHAGTDLRMIAVGRLSAEKGLGGLLVAMASMRADQVRLVIVGDGPMRGELEAQAIRLGVANRIEFLGRLAEQDTLAEIAKSDLFVLPSFMEGLPIVLMEALALGVPVVASRVAGIPELVEDGKTGLLFAPSNWTELAAALDQLAADPNLRREKGRQGPIKVADDFDIRKSAVKLKHLF